MRHREPGGSIVLLQLRKKYLSKLIYCLLIIARRACHRVKLSSVGVSRLLVCAIVGIASRTAHPQPSSQNVRGLPTWVQWRAGEPRMTLYSNSNGKWAVTQPEHVGRHDARWLAACCFFFLMARRALLFCLMARRALLPFFLVPHACAARARAVGRRWSYHSHASAWGPRAQVKDDKNFMIMREPHRGQMPQAMAADGDGAWGRCAREGVCRA